MLYNATADSFYIMKLCSRIFILYCRSRPKYDNSRHFDPHFEEVRDGGEPWWMARWKARAEFLLSVVELLFLSLTAAVWTAGFHWWNSGNIMRTQNVSEYMLVLALCLVDIIRYVKLLLKHFCTFAKLTAK